MATSRITISLLIGLVAMTMGATGSCCACPLPAHSPSVVAERDAVFKQYFVGTDSYGKCTNCHTNGGSGVTRFDMGNGSVDQAVAKFIANGLLPSADSPDKLRLNDPASSPLSWYRAESRMPLGIPERPNLDRLNGFLANYVAEGKTALQTQADCEKARTQPTNGGGGGITCTSPKVACGSTCVDTRTSSASCGACGHRCPASTECRASACVATAPECPNPNMLKCSCSDGRKLGCLLASKCNQICGPGG